MYSTPNYSNMPLKYILRCDLNLQNYIFSACDLSRFDDKLKKLFEIKRK
jgi:hypothetical protein